MNEIRPGLMHWIRHHEGIQADVSSYYLLDERVLLDPMEPSEGMDWFREEGPPAHILLSNRHHYRHSGNFVEAFGCEVHASRPGMHEFSDDQPVTAFDFGDELPGGVTAHEVGVICPDETALHIPAKAALAVADGVINYGGLGFVPDEHLGDDVDGVKAALKARYAELAESLEFDNLLISHGPPIVGGAREALAAFAGG